MLQVKTSLEASVIRDACKAINLSCLASTLMNWLESPSMLMNDVVLVMVYLIPE